MRPISSLPMVLHVRTVALALSILTVGAAAQQPPRPVIGVALGGGSAKGFAHAGVLQWFEEHRIPVDAIAGTSTGAAIGGAYAMGMSAAEIQTLLRTTDWERVMRSDLLYSQKSFRRKEDDREFAIKLDAGLRRGFQIQSGMNPGHGVGLLLSRLALPYSSVDSFDDLPIRFRCVATDLETGEAVELDRGPLGPALRASMALPGTFDTVRLRGRLLSDGGILDSVPVDVARGMGTEVVIAIAMDKLKPRKPSESIGGVANRAIDLMMRSLERPRLERADVVIVPDLEGLGSADYAKSTEFAIPNRASFPSMFPPGHIAPAI